MSKEKNNKKTFKCSKCSSPCILTTSLKVPIPAVSCPLERRKFDASEWVEQVENKIPKTRK
jgi:hypothetical protein